MKILIIAPFHDLATSISSTAVDFLILWIQNRNIVLNKQGRKLIQYKSLRFIAANRWAIPLNQGYDGIFYFGHGLKDRLGDFAIGFLPIIDTKNCNLLAGSVVYTMACYSGETLAPTCINRGVKAYFGQTTQFYGFMPTIKQEYLADWYRLVNVIPISLMLGNSCSRALEEYEGYANELRVKYLVKPPSVNSKLLFSNALNMNLYGDKTAKLY